MRRVDLIPVVLIGSVVAFVVMQAAQRRSAPPTIAVAEPTRAEPPPATVRIQGRADPAPAAAERRAQPNPLDGMVELRLSGEPPPQRDDEAIRMRIRENATSTYLVDVLQQQDQMLMRWPERRLNALRVWIDRQPDAAGWQSQYAVVAERAFDEWREAGFPVLFHIVPDSANTSIQIRWVTRFPPGDGRRIGVTNKARDQHGWLHRAEILIALRDAQGAPIPPEIVAGIARHEVGHALGLGHSSSPTDVMFPESRTPVISAADRATLHLLYTLPPGVVR